MRRARHARDRARAAPPARRGRGVATAYGSPEADDEHFVVRLQSSGHSQSIKCSWERNEACRSLCCTRALSQGSHFSRQVSPPPAAIFFGLAELAASEASHSADSLEGFILHPDPRAVAADSVYRSTSQPGVGSESLEKFISFHGSPSSLESESESPETTKSLRMKESKEVEPEDPRATWRWESALSGLWESGWNNCDCCPSRSPDPARSSSRAHEGRCCADLPF